MWNSKQMSGRGARRMLLEVPWHGEGFCPPWWSLFTWTPVTFHPLHPFNKPLVSNYSVPSSGSWGCNREQDDVLELTFWQRRRTVSTHMSTGEKCCAGRSRKEEDGTCLPHRQRPFCRGTMAVWGACAHTQSVSDGFLYWGRTWLRTCPQLP